MKSILFLYSLCVTFFSQLSAKIKKEFPGANGSEKLTDHFVKGDLFLVSGLPTLAYCKFFENSTLSGLQTDVQAFLTATINQPSGSFDILRVVYNAPTPGNRAYRLGLFYSDAAAYIVLGGTAKIIISQSATIKGLETDISTKMALEPNPTDELHVVFSGQEPGQNEYSAVIIWPDVEPS